MSAKNVNIAVNEIFIYIFLLFILFLTSINIANYQKLKTIKVLGAETNRNSETISEQTKFWQKLLSENPSYVPGWIEIGRSDKALEIDPNYQLEISN